MPCILMLVRKQVFRISIRMVQDRGPCIDLLKHICVAGYPSKRVRFHRVSCTVPERCIDLDTRHGIRTFELPGERT